MHEIQPHYRWRDEYAAEEDPQSPLYEDAPKRRTFVPRLYNFVLNPEWDEFGSSTLYLKVLFADYDATYAMIELIGEWNDTLHNDVMLLKRRIIEPMLDAGVAKFVFFCEHLLNFHASQDDDYYAEWHEEVMDAGGWIMFVNTRQHVEEEMQAARLHHYAHFGATFNDVFWRVHKPAHAFLLVEERLEHGVRLLGE
jgi:hypothetical protein